MRQLFVLWCALLCSFSALAQSYPATGASPSTQQNYRVSTFFRMPVTLAGLSATRTIDQENQVIEYLDGLGRPVQTVNLKGSPTFMDVVQIYAYNGYGLQPKVFEPYASAGSSNGSFKAAALSEQAAYYGSSGWDGHVTKTAAPFSVTVYEDSPLHRPLEQGFPGSAWQPAGSRGTTGRTQVFGYSSNYAADVRLWTVHSSGASYSGTYAASTLSRRVVKDENWTTGLAGIREQFSDNQGRLLLERVWKSDTEMLDTYYLYDLAGQLRYVVPPGFSGTSFTDGNSGFEQYIYAYRYDARGRVAQQKTPGQGWTYLVYNANDQVVLTQDAVQRANSPMEWTYFKYNAFGEQVISGIYRAAYGSQQAAQLAVSAHETSSGQYWESRSGASYTNVSFPTSALTPLYTAYYDNYTFTGASDPALAPTGITPSVHTQGMLTGRLVYRDDGTDPMLEIYYYDDYGQIVQTASQNHLGGVDYTTNTYSFTGELLSSKAEHRASPSGAVTTVLTTHTYDHQGRLLDTRKKVNTQAELIQSRLAYNQIGQLRQKQLHSTNDGSTFAGSLEYSYNERGWLTKSASAHFTQELRYNQPAAGATAQYNGNISEQHWGHGTTTPNRFVYAYDALDRLISGISTTSGMSESMVYDNMGNITSLTRDGGTAITYSYSGNRLTALSGGISGSYSYDANGNALTDRNGLTYTYNHLNLPKTATKMGTSVSYTYDALGTRLRSVGAQAPAQIRDYVGGFEYVGGVLERIHSEEGYIGLSGSTSYHYYQQDHLGNVRSVLTPFGSGFTVIQQQDYYPYGMRKSLAGPTQNLYLYNGKEIQGELGGQYDYGARFYDPVIGRWSVVDPLAENHYEVSAYAYVLNNPLGYTDPFGLDTLSANTDYMQTYREGVDVVVIDEVIVTAPNRSGGRNYGGDGSGSLADKFMYGLDQVNQYLPTTHLLNSFSYAFTGGDILGNRMGFGEAMLGAASILPIGKIGGVAARGVGNIAAKTGIANSRALGIAGEQAVGVGSKTRIPSLTGTAKYRIPDQLTSTTLGEVKNVSHLSLTRQLTDFHMFSQQTGRQFILYTRPNTTFSGPLQNLINNGSIITKPIPFK